jgi:hypothetical protein
VGPDLCSACAFTTPAVFHTVDVFATGVIDTLQGVVDATQELLDATEAVAAVRLHHLQALITDALLLLGHPTNPPTTGA